MIQTYKYMHGEYDSDVNKIFKRTHETRTRGHDLKLFKERALTATRAQFFTSRVIDTWNSLIYGHHFYESELLSLYDITQPEVNTKNRRVTSYTD